MATETLLRDLEPTVEPCSNGTSPPTKEWFPHELVPYGRGRDAVPGHQWTEDDADLGGVTIDDGVRSALIVNLLTEDNLPYYFRSIESMFGDRRRVGHLGPALDGRGGSPLDGDLRLPDVHAGGRPGGSSSEGGWPRCPAATRPIRDTTVESFVYLTLQELATRIAHRNTGKLVGDPVGYGVMMRVAADENLHHLFYRDLATAAIGIAPNRMLPAIEKQVVGFAMPGLGIPASAATPPRSPAPASTTSPSTTTRSSCRCCCATGRSTS